MSLEAEFLEALEVHSPDAIRTALAAGASATDPVKGKSPLDSLIEGYLRSPRFAECIRVLTDAGATFDVPLLEALLLDDAAALGRALHAMGPGAVSRRVRVPSAFTSCSGVTPLHVCAEFNDIQCARVLLEAGADVNARAELDADGFGGQTSIFHCVSNIYDFGRPVMELLVEAGANLDVRLKGVVWGAGAPWETLVLDVTPVSYAQCGLYAQFHRPERDVYDNLAYLYRSRYGTELPVYNVPNRYLAS
ncbi:MAG: ankyrin repeat domain-containing protein [Gemmatimonadaceae bacterium]